MCSLQGDDFVYIDIAGRGLFSFLRGCDPLKPGVAMDAALCAELCPQSVSSEHLLKEGCRGPAPRVSSAQHPASAGRALRACLSGERISEWTVQIMVLAGISVFGILAYQKQGNTGIFQLLDGALSLFGKLRVRTYLSEVRC